MSQTSIGADQRKIASNRATRVSGNDKIKLSTSSLESSQKYPQHADFNPEQKLEISSDGMSDSQPIGEISNAGRRRPTEEWDNAWSSQRGGQMEQNDPDMTNELDQTEDELF